MRLQTVFTKFSSNSDEGCQAGICLVPEFVGTGTTDDDEELEQLQDAVTVYSNFCPIQ